MISAHGYTEAAFDGQAETLGVTNLPIARVALFGLSFCTCIAGVYSKPCLFPHSCFPISFLCAGFTRSPSMA